MARRKKPDAFDVDMTPEKRDELASELCFDIEEAFSARTSVIGDGGLIDRLDSAYEQERRAAEDLPFDGAADLPSFIIYENVSAMKARLVKTVTGTEPFCTVDGWGPDAKKAPVVEAFHEWKVKEEGLHGELGKVVLGALIEDCFVLEVRQRVETRKVIDEIDAALELNESGFAIFDEAQKGVPRFQMKDGEFVRAQAGQPSGRVKVTSTKTKKLGPEYECISMRDFVFLPGHAKNQRQVYGYAYRIWARLPELQEGVADGIYDKDAVEALGETSDRELEPVPVTVDSVAPQYGPAKEKELLQLSIKRDLDGDGREEWYIATVSLQSRKLLRLKLDKFVMKVGRPRCVPFVLYPRRDSVYGYSYAETLATLADEHTALREMVADRGNLATNAPFTLLNTSKWDPSSDPIGIGKPIVVRSHDEIKQLQISDVPASAEWMLREIMSSKERVGGLSDMAIGLQSASSRTLGENQMVQMGSAVRVEEPLGYLRDAISEVMLLRQAIWEEALESETRGVVAPDQVAQGLQITGNDLQDGRITVDMIRGNFRFKPYGSVDTADSGMRMQYFNQFMSFLTNLAKASPQIVAPVFQNQEVIVRLLQEGARLYKFRDVNVFIKALAQPMPLGLPAGGGMTPTAPMAGAPTGEGNPMDVLSSLLAGKGGPVATH